MHRLKHKLAVVCSSKRCHVFYSEKVQHCTLALFGDVLLKTKITAHPYT